MNYEAMMSSVRAWGGV